MLKSNSMRNIVLGYVICWGAHLVTENKIVKKGSSVAISSLRAGAGIRPLYSEQTKKLMHRGRGSCMSVYLQMMTSLKTLWRGCYSLCCAMKVLLEKQRFELSKENCSYGQRLFLYQEELQSARRLFACH